MGSYVPSSADERAKMLEFLGIDSYDKLFSDIPKKAAAGELNLPAGLSEMEVASKMEEIAWENKVYPVIFRGGGAYDHYIPTIVDAMASKEEFLTAYTPYQAEVSQGLLQSIFEYQTMICDITGMDVSNASVYDGASAAAEGVAMCRERKRQTVLVAESANPRVTQTIKTYCEAADAPFVLVPQKNGVTDLDSLEKLLTDNIACFYMQQPNFFGIIESSPAEILHGAGAKLVMGVYPTALGLLKTPAEQGADIAVGEGQPFGIPLSNGGPYLGFMACKKQLLRRMPGRIAGQTTDEQGRRAFVLTMQAREQHIRRERAQSNICSNQALCAMRAAVYMSAMGPEGLYKTAISCTSKAHYMAKALENAGLSLKYNGEFFNEFLTECEKSDEVLKKLDECGILGGLPVDGGILWCVTEKNTKADIDRAVKIVSEVCGK